MEFKNLTEYANEIMRCKSMPDRLAEIHIELASKYAMLSDIAKDIQLEKAVFWNMKFAPEKPLSDTFVEAKWLQEEGGKKELKLKYELKALEKLMSAIKSSIVVNSVEARQGY